MRVCGSVGGLQRELCMVWYILDNPARDKERAGGGGGLVLILAASLCFHVLSL